MAKETTKKSKRASTPESYNASQAGKLWTWSELPSHISDCRKRPALFVEVVRGFQKGHGLTADGKLGPKTLAKIRAVWSVIAPPAKEANPEPKAKDDADDAGAD